MSTADTKRTESIHNELQDSGQMSDDDIQYLTALLKKPSTWPGISNFTVLSLFAYVKKYTPAQEEIMYQTTVPYLSAKEYDRDIGNSRQIAAMTMGHLRDKRAVPLLIPLLHDKYPYVRKAAAKALQKLGYNAPLQS